MPKMFLAGPFKALVKSGAGSMSSEDIRMFSSIIEFFEAAGWDVHCAHRREKWGREFMTPDECTVIDHREISACDVFVAFPGAPASPGTHVELGWASAMKKPIVLLLEKDKEYAFLVQGLPALTPVRNVYYSDKQVNNKHILDNINELVAFT